MNPHELDKRAQLPDAHPATLSAALFPSVTHYKPYSFTLNGVNKVPDYVPILRSSTYGALLSD